MFSFLAAFKSFFLILDFQQFDYNVPWNGFLCFYPAYSLLSFLVLRFIVFIKIGKVFAIISFIHKYFFCFPLSLFPSGSLITHMLDCLLLSTGHWDFVNLKNVYFLLCASFWIVSIFMSSSSLIFPPVVPNLLSFTSNEFFFQKLYLSSLQGPFSFLK